MDPAQETAAVREMQAFVHGTALRSRALASDAPLFASVLRESAPMLGVNSEFDALEALLSRLDGDQQLQFLHDTDLAGRAQGRDWAAVLRMLFNLADRDDTLTTRRRTFRVPPRLSESYRVHSTKSSKLRTELEPDAYRVLLLAAESMTPVPGSASKSAASLTTKDIRPTIRRLVANHGLNDPEWSTAISSQYFLCLLARRLDLASRTDYMDLLNRFLESFALRVDDSIVLNPEHVLVTAQETERIRDQMRDEDRRDPYFKKAAKTRAEAVNAEDLHINYLYGLTLGITSESEARITDVVRDVALAHLLDAEQTGQILDLDGGWRPYRIPWLTARILISFRQLPAEKLEDERVQGVIHNACASLVDRLTDELHWRSGVGDWVSVWESTGLCLEALLGFSSYLEDPSILSRVTVAALERFADWAVTPRFDDDDAANATLAAVILGSVLIQSADRLGVAVDRELRRQIEALVIVALKLAAESPEPRSRQFCTIPQIAYYSTHLLKD